MAHNSIFTSFPANPAHAGQASAVAIKLKHGFAAANLAALFRLTGSYQAADTLLSKALARNPANAAHLRRWRIIP